MKYIVLQIYWYQFYYPHTCKELVSLAWFFVWVFCVDLISCLCQVLDFNTVQKGDFLSAAANDDDDDNTYKGVV